MPPPLAQQSPAASPRPSASFLFTSPRAFLSLALLRRVLPFSPLHSHLRPASRLSLSLSLSLTLSRLFLTLVPRFVVIFALSPPPAQLSAPPSYHSPLPLPRAATSSGSPFFVFSSMSTNNSLPFYSYFLFRFPPAYSRTAESSLFFPPHSPARIYAPAPLTSSPSEPRRFLPPFTSNAVVSKPIARAFSLSPFPQLARSLTTSRCRSSPMRAAFSPATVIVN